MPDASCVCSCEQSLPRIVPPTLKPPSVISTWEAEERCSEHRLDGNVGCPAPQLSSAQLTGSASSTRQHFQGKEKETTSTTPTHLPSQESSPCSLLGRFCRLQNQDVLTENQTELAEGSWLQRRSQSAGRPSKMTFLQPDSSNVIIPTNYFHDLI